MPEARDDRLTTLELRFTEQGRTVEELSALINEQWKEIERLRARLRALEERFSGLEEQSSPPIEATRPPHW